MARFDIPRITKAKALTPFKVEVIFDNNISAEIDLGDHLKRFVIFNPLLRDKDLWSQMQVDKELYCYIAWPNPKDDSHIPELEVPTDVLWRLHLEQAGQIMSPQAFTNWMNRHRLSLKKAAHTLDISRRMAAYYKSGERLIPKTILLACKGYDSRVVKSNVHYLFDKGNKPSETRSLDRETYVYKHG